MAECSLFIAQRDPHFCHLDYPRKFSSHYLWPLVGNDLWIRISTRLPGDIDPGRRGFDCEFDLLEPERPFTIGYARFPHQSRICRGPDTDWGHGSRRTTLGLARNGGNDEPVFPDKYIDINDEDSN